MNPVRRGASTRVQMRKSMASAPAPLEPGAPPLPEDYAEFLRVTLPQQEKAVASHRFGSERVWLKKAGQRHHAVAPFAVARACACRSCWRSRPTAC